MEFNKSLRDLFSETWVINLKRRPDRLERLWGRLHGINWPFGEPKVFNAIDGDKVGVPRYWQTGGGSYGCLRSHLTLLERAIQEDVESILILEDDVEFRPNFREGTEEFFSKVPDDWQCLMFRGGNT